ncbi:DUF6602 domain-containing protein [Arthrobacter glacialis]|uniref:DUF6602 domain-containing protein n=1 Tax=Arthrobacter glacialis TaxID=1664 RepID=UPI003C2C285D
MAGHSGEDSWIRLLQDWLPPHYEVAKRKYIVPEVGDYNPKETDIVILRPGYPKSLRSRTDILASGVAAAFSVKLSLDSSGIREAAFEASQLRRAIYSRDGDPRSELQSPVAFGILAHTHSWRGRNSRPAYNVLSNLSSFDRQYSQHPRETLDFTCIADLGTWTKHIVPYHGPNMRQFRHEAQWANYTNGFVETSVSAGPSPYDGRPPTPPIARFLAALYRRLAQTDPELSALADGFLYNQSGGPTTGFRRIWDVKDVYSPHVLDKIPFTPGPPNSRWAQFYS